MITIPDALWTNNSALAPSCINAKCKTRVAPNGMQNYFGAL